MTPAMDANQLKEKALQKLSDYIDSMEESKAKKLSYWLIDYTKLLNAETTFDPKKLVRYKRGSVVKAHLGYRVGSEEGGLHYAIVLDNNNRLSDKTVTVIPLTSIKPGTDLNSLHPSKLPLGNEIYDLLISKANQKLKELSAKKEELEQLKTADIEVYIAMVNDFEKRFSSARKVVSEIQKMKAGSIALVGQITTISKQRIYDPLYKGDVLTSIRVSPTTLDKIDEKMVELYGHLSQNR